MPDGVIGNTLDSESRESRFDPWLGNEFVGVSKTASVVLKTNIFPCSTMVVRHAVNVMVLGSSPSEGASYCRVFGVGIRSLPLKQIVAGSIPAPATKFIALWCSGRISAFEAIGLGSIPSGATESIVSIVH